MFTVNFYKEVEDFLQSQGDLVESQYQHLTRGKGFPFYDISPLPAEEQERLQEEGAPHYDAVFQIQKRYWVLGARLAMRENQSPAATFPELIEADGELNIYLAQKTEALAQTLMAESKLPIPEEDVANAYITSIYLRGADQLGTFVAVGYCWVRALLGKFFLIEDDYFLLEVCKAFFPPKG